MTKQWYILLKYCHFFYRFLLLHILIYNWKLFQQKALYNNNDISYFYHVNIEQNTECKKLRDCVTMVWIPLIFGYCRGVRHWMFAECCDHCTAGDSLLELLSEFVCVKFCRYNCCYLGYWHSQCLGFSFKKGSESGYGISFPFVP